MPADRGSASEDGARPDRLRDAWAVSPAAGAAARLLGVLGAAEPAAEKLLRGRSWVPLCALVALLLALAFSTPGFGTGSEAFERRVRLGWSPAVQMKIDDPLHGMSHSFPEWTNQAKRSFRITAPAVAYLTGSGVAGAVAFSYLCLYAALHCAVVLGRRLLGTRSAGFFAALLLAATYFGTAAFKDAFYWFDSVSYGLLLLAMAASRPWLRGMALFAACFSDERALLMAPLTLVRFGRSSEDARAFRSEALATLLAVIGYLSIRIALGLLLGLGTPTAGIGLDGLAFRHFEQLVASLWAPFEGAWLVFGVGFMALLAKPWDGRPAALAGFLYFGGYLASCFLVSDITRSMSFAFVALFPLLRAMALRLDGGRLRALLALASLVCLLVPNLFVWNDLTLEVGLLARLLGAL